jgi:hypothetical protein
MEDGAAALDAREELRRRWMRERRGGGTGRERAALPALNEGRLAALGAREKNDDGIRIGWGPPTVSITYPLFILSTKQISGYRYTHFILQPNSKYGYPHPLRDTS